jgi:hypothetical protein
MISGTPTNILDFMTSAQVADALAGTRTLNLQAVLQTAVNACIANGTALYIPSAIKSMRVDTPVAIDYATLGQKTLSIFGDAVTGYYQNGMGSEIYYSGTSGYLFQIDGRAADVGGAAAGGAPDWASSLRPVTQRARRQRAGSQGTRVIILSS